MPAKKQRFNFLKNRVIKPIGSQLGRLKAFIFSAFPTVSSFFVGLPAYWSRPSYSVLSQKGQRNPYSYTALVLIAYNLASIFKNVKVKVPGKDGLEDDPNHPILDLLKKPNADQSISDFMIEGVHHLMYGGAMIMWNLGVIGSFKPTSIRLIRPDRMTQVDRDEHTFEITQFRGINPMNRPWSAPASDVCWLKIYNPQDDNVGWPLMASILQALDLFDNLMDWQGSISQHKGRVPGWFVTDDTLEDDQFLRTKEGLHDMYKSGSKESLPMLLEGGIRFEQNGMTPDNAQLKDQMMSLVRMVAVGLGIDPALLGDNANKTYSNFQEAVRALIQLKVLPLTDWILDQMTCWYMPKYNTPLAVLAYDESDIKQLREDLNSKMERLVKGVASTIITPDEARQDLGKNEKGGNAAKLLTKVGTIPLDEAGLTFDFGGDEPIEEDAAEKLLLSVYKQLERESKKKTPSNGLA